MIVKTRLLPPGATAFTAWPFVFIHPDHAGRELLLRHEAVHYAQQRLWAIRGLGVGLLVWFALYLLALPVWWNRWRRKWETEAFRAEGLTDENIAEVLTRAPYYLRRSRS